ncbi:hypothetical protein F8C76_07850 [Flagellimonas olearia]|uniref:Uncharacterized protein n=1 Tax=Flagellimonas olearia TaxID=552546 RepID=A0A6I1ECB5_9FLAO|nr:hypothetical protein [Allomuricauda olearia]KAB7531394.1 hypothetical protein F8C76_07850 [Allomuricauda olearia]
MKITKTLILAYFAIISNLGHGQQQNGPHRSEYYAVLPFWESPYQPVKGGYPITKEEAMHRINLKVDYNTNNQVIATHVRIGKEYKEFEGRFGNLNINAPHTKIIHSPDKEVHHFFDRFGNRVSVMGNVYAKIYEKDALGKNRSLTFTDVHGEPATDWFGVVRYQWFHEPNGSLIEERLDSNGELVPLRGDFQFLRTRMTFDGQGYFGTLENIDSEGNLVNTDNGAAFFKYYYDSQGRFDRWEVFDANGKPAIGPSHTAGEQNVWNGYDLQDIVFFDQEKNPATHWSGAERWHFETDGFGNNTLLEFQDGDGNPKNANGGYSKYVAEWTTDGRFLLSETYLDKEGLKTVHKTSGVHRVEYSRDPLGLILEKRYLDTDHNLMNRKDTGVAIEKRSYHDNHGLNTTELFDVDGNRIQNP